MATAKHIPDKARSAFSHWFAHRRRYLPDPGFGVLVAVILLLSALGSLDFSPNIPLVVAGEPAPADIVADRSLLFEDHKSTGERREQVRRLQPIICDLDLDAVDRLYTEVQNTLTAVNQAQNSDDKEQIRRTLMGSGVEEISQADINALSTTQVQAVILEQVLPMVQRLLREGVLEDLRTVFAYKGGIMVRNAQTGEEIQHQELQGVQDLKSVNTYLAAAVKDLPLSNQG